MPATNLVADLKNLVMELLAVEYGYREVLDMLPDLRRAITEAEDVARTRLKRETLKRRNHHGRGSGHW